MRGFAERYRTAAFAVLALAVLTLGFLIVLPFVPALLWATVLSILMAPLNRRIETSLGGVQKVRQKGIAETASALITTLITLVIICIPFLLIGIGLYGQISDVVRQLETTSNGQRHSITLEGVATEIDARLTPLATRLGAPDFSVTAYVRENGSQIVQNLRQPVGRAARTIGFTALTLVVALLTMFFMLRDGHRLRGPAVDLLPFSPERADALFKRIGETVHAVFIGTVLVAIIQGTIMGLAYAWVGLPNALLLGAFSVLLCIVPLLGAPVLYVPIGVSYLLRGDYPSAAKILLIGFLLVSQIDNFLKPFFIGGRVNLHPMAIFFSILGGVLYFGPVGVMAGPMVLTVLLALQDIVRERTRETLPEGQLGPQLSSVPVVPPVVEPVVPPVVESV